MTDAVHLASGNPGKVEELGRLLASALRLVPPPRDWTQPEETGATFEENALLKARALAGTTGRAALADDSGLEVDALGGAPGVHSARYARDDAARIRRLLDELAAAPGSSRSARFRCVLALVRPDGTEVLADGVCEGVIAASPRGAGGFGYDPVFVPAGERRTFAEMTRREKGAFSHRGAAARLLVEKLSAGG